MCTLRGSLFDWLNDRSIEEIFFCRRRGLPLGVLLIDWLIDKYIEGVNSTCRCLFTGFGGLVDLLINWSVDWLIYRIYEAWIRLEDVLTLPLVVLLIYWLIDCLLVWLIWDVYSAGDECPQHLVLIDWFMYWWVIGL